MISVKRSWFYNHYRHRYRNHRCRRYYSYYHHHRSVSYTVII